MWIETRIFSNDVHHKNTKIYFITPFIVVHIAAACA